MTSGAAHVRPGEDGSARRRRISIRGRVEREVSPAAAATAAATAAFRVYSRMHVFAAGEMR